MICIQKIYGFVALTIKLSREVEMLRLSRTNGQRTEDGKWKIEQCSGGPETAKCNFYKSSFEIKFAALFFFKYVQTYNGISPNV